MLSRGFFRRRPDPPREIPPGQYYETGFPVLTAGPTPKTPLEEWTFGLHDLEGEPMVSWTWEEFQSLPQTEFTTDIHCVTKWSKLDVTWKGVTIVDLLESAGITPPGKYVMAFSDKNYTTNLPLDDLLDGKCMIALEYEGEPLERKHGGPARLLVPHLYFWKSAKWVRGLKFMEKDSPGFWEQYGYHMYGDPWKEQRYRGD